MATAAQHPKPSARVVDPDPGDAVIPLHSPPPYTATAYAPTAPARRLGRVHLSLRLVPVSLAVALTLAVGWLCLAVERASRPGAFSPYHGTHSHVLDQQQAPISSPHTQPETSALLERFRASLAKCAALETDWPERVDPKERTENPRWQSATGQKVRVVLRNATLFDGETFLSGDSSAALGGSDIVFEKGLVVAVTKTSDAVDHRSTGPDAKTLEYDVAGRWVTPGLVDMHSHHLIGIWPELFGGEEANEMSPMFGPLTPFLRAIDGLHPYDIGAAIIASGGVTSSLIIPGSANIMGGEGVTVKNVRRPGENREPVVEDMLLEHGVPEEKRHRYMKMACGENPKRVYGHTRMGNAWILRKHFAKAKELKDKQDAWCEGARRVSATADDNTVRTWMAMDDNKSGFPEDLELESTVGLLRGRVAMHNHCYLPNDLETMLRVTTEFGVRVRAFHHAIEAWQVPEMIKQMGQ